MFMRSKSIATKNLPVQTNSTGVSVASRVPGLVKLTKDELDFSPRTNIDVQRHRRETLQIVNRKIQEIGVRFPVSDKPEDRLNLEEPCITLLSNALDRLNAWRSQLVT